MTDDWLPVDRWPEPLVLRYGNDEALKRRGLDRFVAAKLREEAAMSEDEKEAEMQRIWEGGA